jgi:hypothetical protein
MDGDYRAIFGVNEVGIKRKRQLLEIELSSHQETRLQRRTRDFASDTKYMSENKR